MNTSLDCIPCFVRQSLDAARIVTDDIELQKQILQEALRAASELDFSEPPPVVAQRIHRKLRAITGIDDPYRPVKDQFNRLAWELLPGLEEQVKTADDPLCVAARMAIAGNVIDLGVGSGITEDGVREAFGQVLTEPFHGEVDAFRDAVEKAEKILYLADNSGEIVFDRLLVEQLPRERVTLAVRGGPILNDATMPDAHTAKMHELVELTDNGSDAPGTILSDCSDAFQKRYREADLIISKGQGNFETLSGRAGKDPIFFLFKVKCPVVADRIDLKLGTHVLMKAV